MIASVQRQAGVRAAPERRSRFAVATALRKAAREAKATSKKRVAPLPPRGPERAYRAALLSEIRAIAALIKSELFPVAKQELSRRDLHTHGVRLDAPGDVARAMGKVRIELVRRETRTRAAQVAAAAATRTERHARKQASRVIGIPVATSPAETARLRAFVSDNVARITSIEDGLLSEVEQLVQTSVATGRRWESLRDEILERFSVSESRAQLIAVDQTLRLNADLSQAKAQSLGVTKYVWSTSRDQRVRESHRDLDGQEFSYTDPPVVDEKTGRRANPGGDFQCRCIAVPLVDDLL